MAVEKNPRPNLHETNLLDMRVNHGSSSLHIGYATNQREGGGVVVEHQTPNREVLGLTPTGGTMLCP